MIVLGICAALIVGFVNLRDKPFIQMIEGHFLDWRFILRGPIPVDPNIELVLIDQSATEADNKTPVSIQQLIHGIEAIVSRGARTIVLDPRLLPMSAPGAVPANSGGDINFAAALGHRDKVIIPYVFSLSSSPRGRSALPTSIKNTAYSVIRSRDSATSKRPPEAGGYRSPGAELLKAGLPGHVTYVWQQTRSRQFAYPVIGYGKSYYPSLAVQAYLRSVDLPIAAVEVNFGGSLTFGSFYVPTDNQMRIAVNYHGPAGSYKQTRFADLIDGSLAADGFEGKIVLVGIAATSGGGAFETAFGSNMSEVEFLANVIDNYGRMDPLVRSQQVIVLDILLLALIGLFFSLVAAVRSNWAVLTLAALVTVLFLAGSLQAFALFNLWLGLTFPLMAMFLSTATLMATKHISKRRRAALKVAQEAEEVQFSAPWNFDRVAKTTDATEEILEEEEKEGNSEPQPEEEILTLTTAVEESASESTEEELPEPEEEYKSNSVAEPESMAENVTPFTPRKSPTPPSSPSSLPVPPVSPFPTEVAPAEEVEEPDKQKLEQKSKKPASLTPVMESDARRDKVAVSFVSEEAKLSPSVNEFDVAVLYINMSGFKALAKSFGPTRAVQFLHAVYQLIEKTVVKHAGFLEQFGDNDDVMALFGLPEGSAKDAENCLRSTRELVAALSEWGERQGFPSGKTAEFCICADYGPMRIHAGGDDDDPEISLSGYTIGLVSRLDKTAAAKGAGVVVTETLMARVCETNPSGELKDGFAEQPMQKVPGAAELLGLWRAENDSF